MPPPFVPILSLDETAHSLHCAFLQLQKGRQLSSATGECSALPVESTEGSLKPEARYLLALRASRVAAAFPVQVGARFLQAVLPHLHAAQAGSMEGAGGLC